MTDKVILLEEIKEHLNNTTEVLNEAKEVILRLEKENMELKKACDETQELLDKQIEATYKLFEENKELKEKAKEIVTALLNVFVYDLADDEMDSGNIDVKVKAEQFLNSLRN